MNKSSQADSSLRKRNTPYPHFCTQQTPQNPEFWNAKEERERPQVLWAKQCK